MALRHFRTGLLGSQLIDLLNGTLASSGSPAALTRDGHGGCTNTAASADVSGAAGTFAEVEVGDRFYISGVDDEYTVMVKTDDAHLTLSDTVPTAHTSDSGIWRAYRGDRIDPDDISEIISDGNAASQRFSILYKVTTFG